VLYLENNVSAVRDNNNNNNMSAMIIFCVFLSRDQHLFFAETRYKTYTIYLIPIYVTGCSGLLNLYGVRTVQYWYATVFLSSSSGPTITLDILYRCLALHKSFGY